MIYNRMRGILHAPTYKVAIVGTIVLALLVQVVEFMCTSGFPALFTRILTLKQLDIAAYYGYLLLYISAYMLDDVIVLGIGVTLLSRHRCQEKEGRVLKLIAGVVMIGSASTCWPTADRRRRRRAGRIGLTGAGGATLPAFALPDADLAAAFDRLRLRQRLRALALAPDDLLRNAPTGGCSLDPGRSFGTQMSMLALPLAAAVLLHASPTQMGILTAMEALPFALFSLPAACSSTGCASCRSTSPASRRWRWPSPA